MPADNSTVSQKCMLHTCKNTCKIFSILPKKKTGCIHCVCMFEKYAIRTPFSSPLDLYFPHHQRSFFLVGEVVDGYAKLWLWPSLGSSCFTRGSRGTNSSFMSMSLFVWSLSILSHQRRNDSQCKAWAIDEHIKSQCIAASPCNSWECDEPQRGRPKRGKSNWSTTLRWMSLKLLSVISACCDVSGFSMFFNWHNWGVLLWTVNPFGVGKLKMFHWLHGP